MPQFVLNTVMLLAYTMIVLILMSLGIGLTQMKVFSLKSSLIGRINELFKELFLVSSDTQIIGIVAHCYFLCGPGAEIIVVKQSKCFFFRCPYRIQ